MCVEVVSVFRYLGVIIEGCGSSTCHAEDRVAKALKAFGALRKPVFADTALSLRLCTKPLCWRVLLYGLMSRKSHTQTSSLP